VSRTTIRLNNVITSLKQTTDCNASEKEDVRRKFYWRRSSTACRRDTCVNDLWTKRYKTIDPHVCDVISIFKTSEHSFEWLPPKVRRKV